MTPVDFSKTNADRETIAKAFHVPPWVAFPEVEKPSWWRHPIWRWRGWRWSREK